MIYLCFTYTKNPEQFVSQTMVSDFSNYHESVKKLVEEEALSFLTESENHYFLFKALAMYFDLEEKKQDES